MEAPEVPIESIQEQIHEHAHHAGGESTKRWILGVALTSAIFAAFAAVASLLAGHHVNEALIDQLQSSNQWAYYQAKSIKSTVLGAKMDLLTALGKEVNPKDEVKRKEYEGEQENIKHEAEHHQHESEGHLKQHVAFAQSVTMFQVAIAVAAVSVLVNRRLFWLVSIGFGMVGVFFIVRALLMH